MCDRFAPLLLGFLLCLSSAQGGEPLATERADLNVAVFKYLPDASSAIERFEEAFESAHPLIDLDLELWNPYDDPVEKDGLGQISRFDIVEIDTCRIDELLGGHLGGLDPLPPSAIRPPTDYVEPASTIMRTELSRYVLPHWVCGNFLIFWTDNRELGAARSFDDFVRVMDPSAGKPVLCNLWGSTGLGEFYADAVLDRVGPEAARSHLRELTTDPSTPLDPAARDAVVALAAELRPAHRANLKHYANHTDVYPRAFVDSPHSALVGYSERLYYAVRMLQLDPSRKLPCLQPKDVTVRAFSFAQSSQGTPTWCDGFVIPKGKLGPKKNEIEAFLQFAISDDGYMPFVEPTPWLAPSYLLPAVASAYDGEILKAQPLLAEFRSQLDGSFPVTDSKVWQGMRRAGAEIKELLYPKP